MLGGPFKRIQPGGQFSAKEENRKASWLESLGKIVGIGNIFVRQSLAGVTIEDRRPQPIFIKTTGAGELSDIDGPSGMTSAGVYSGSCGSAWCYPWTEQTQVCPGVWQDSSTGRSGTALNLPVVDVNSATDVPSGSVGRAYLSPDQTYYIAFFFDSDGDGTTSGFVSPTSLTTTAGYYPGNQVVWDSSGATWNNAGTVWIRALNGETLVVGRRYMAEKADLVGSYYLWILQEICCY
jgi:hypothetical protein